MGLERLPRGKAVVPAQFADRLWNMVHAKLGRPDNQQQCGAGEETAGTNGRHWLGGVLAGAQADSRGRYCAVLRRRTS